MVPRNSQEWIPYRWNWGRGKKKKQQSSWSLGEEKDVAKLKADRDTSFVSLAEISKSLKRFEGEQKFELF